ncbi:unnamed protein product [Gadus morhua 'NCC']
MEAGNPLKRPRWELVGTLDSPPWTHQGPHHGPSRVPSKGHTRGPTMDSSQSLPWTYHGPTMDLPWTYHGPTMDLTWT